MGVWVLQDPEAERAVFYDSNAESPLAQPTFIGTSAREQAWSFLAYLNTDHHAAARVPGDMEPVLRTRQDDPRDYTIQGIERAYFRWRDLAIDEHGRLNDYGWQLCTWQEERPSYGDPAEPAPEPEQKAVA